MKGVGGELGEMKISLRPDARLVIKIPYRLNPSISKYLRHKLTKC
jgi:hypothetical protein